MMASERSLFGAPWWHPVVVLLVVLWLAARIVPEAWTQEPFGVVREPSAQGDQLRLRDFTSHARFVRGVWSGDWRQAEPPPSSAYSPAGHRRMMETWLGSPRDRALPFGYSPTMVWLLAPFAVLPDRVGYLLWTALGLLLVGWLLSSRDDPWLAGVLMFVSPVATWAFYQGQSAIFSTAAFLFLFRHSSSPSRRASFASAVLVLWALTAKPPLALAAGAALLACGRWRVVLMALAVTAGTTALVWPWLGSGWVGDYVALVRSYNSEQADPTFAWCLSPTYMSNLRAVLYLLGFGDARASFAGTALWLVSQMLVMLTGWRRPFSQPAVWALTLLALLLFSPHANLTEELHLYVVAVASAALVGGRTETVARLLPLLCAGVFWLGCLLSTGSTWLYPGPAFAGKVILAGLLLWYGRQRPESGFSGARR